MGKIILFLVLAFAVYMVVKGAVRRNQPPAVDDRPPERMVACGRCGVNVPRSEALEEDGRFYCSEEHRHRGAA